MQLTWQSDQTAIAKALLENFPEEDRLSLSLEQLKNLVSSLPSFDQSAPAPDERKLRAVLWTWMRIADPEMETGT